VLAAVSGGGDSVALLYLLAELAESGAITLAGVAHLNHRLRQADSDADERLCRALASALGLPCVVESSDVAELARSERISVEHAGHRARYAFFDRAATSLGACRVALGHTIDDQAETFLLRLLRGAGLAGFSSIRPRAGLVVRPLLSVGRAELRAYLASRQVEFREDASNLDRRIPRNRIRHDLLPVLRTYTPRVVEVLAREAEIALADDQWLTVSANEMAADLVQTIEGGAALDAVRLASLPAALARRIGREALTEVAGRPVGFADIERLRRMAVGAPTQVDLPGCRAERRGNAIHLTRRPGRGAVPAVPLFVYRLDVPGEVVVPEVGVTITARTVAPGSPGLPASGRETKGALGTEQSVAVAMAAWPLEVRNWLPGDRFRPLGMQGHRKKLQDLFVDRKVNRSNRAKRPLVLDAHGNIIWVVWQGLSDDFRVTTATTSVLMLKVSPLEGSL
jgi:tRNA(Ile)-lysidine synthase